MANVFIDFFRKSIPAPLVFSVFFGLVIGISFGLSILLIVLSNSEKVASYEEVAAV